MTAVNIVPSAVAVSPTGELTALADATRAVPAARPLNKQVRQAWMNFPEINGTVRTPTPEQPWTPEEIANAHSVLETARTLRKAAEDLETAVRKGSLATFNQRADLRAAQDPEYRAQLERAPKDRSGNYILGSAGNSSQIQIPGTEMAITAEYSVQRPEFTIDDAIALRKAKRISRAQFRKMVTTRVVLDVDALNREVSRDLNLRKVINSALHAATGGSIRIHIRKAKAA